MVSAWKNNKILNKWIKKNIYDLFNCNFNYDLSELESDPLLSCISRHTCIEKKYIYVGAGSSQIINALINLPCWDHIILSCPEFKLYNRTAKLANHKIKLIDSIFCKDFVNKLSKRVFNKKDFLCISSPRWFSGEKFTESQIKKILSLFPGTILIDEAYIDFSSDPSGLIDLCLKNDRIMILRTFSKKYYLSGLRVGYLITKKKLKGLRNTAIPPHSISSFSSNFIIKLLRDEKIMKVFDNTLDKIKENRDYLYDKLTKFNNFKIIKSESNFITLIFDNSNDFKRVSNKISMFPGVQIFGDKEKLYIKIWISNFDLMNKIYILVKEIYD